jgi:hypothetical protein
MLGYMPVEYSKWVAGVLVQNATEEQARRAALEGMTPAGAVDAVPSPRENTAEQSHLDSVRARILELLAAKRATSAGSNVAHPTPKLARPPSLAAIRMRRSRKRRRDKLRVVPFEIRTDEIDGLVTHGLLDPVARNNRDEIANALGRLFDRVPPNRWPVPAAR